MDEIYRKLSMSVDATFRFDNGVRYFESYEVWSHGDSRETRPYIEKYAVESIQDFLRNGGQSAVSRGDTLLLQLVLVTVVQAEKTQIIRLPESVHGDLIETLGLGLANAYLETTVTSVSAFPPTTVLGPGKECYAYAFSHAPKLAAIWSQIRYTDKEAWNNPGPTRGIVYITEDSKGDNATNQRMLPAAKDMTPKTLFVKLLQSTWRADLYSSSMAPALLLAMQLSLEIDITQRRIKSSVSDIESKTGYHNFKSRVVASSKQLELGELAMRASGSATKLASVERKSASMKKVLEFISAQLDKDGVQEEGSARHAAQQLLRHHVGVLQERLEMQALDTRYIMKRAEIQIDAVFHMMTQEDSLNGIELAKSTHLIAHASYRDSSSMKTLAIVTMFFLPGSFVSAIFSMPMFDWDKAKAANTSSIAVSLFPQFSLYWAITLPLTLATFCLYFTWLWHLKRQRNREFERISHKKQYSSDGEEEELTEDFGGRLARRRRETTL